MTRACDTQQGQRPDLTLGDVRPWSGRGRFAPRRHPEDGHSDHQQSAPPVRVLVVRHGPRLLRPARAVCAPDDTADVTRTTRGISAPTRVESQSSAFQHCVDPAATREPRVRSGLARPGFTPGRPFARTVASLTVSWLIDPRAEAVPAAPTKQPPPSKSAMTGRLADVCRMIVPHLRRRWLLVAVALQWLPVGRADRQARTPTDSTENSFLASPAASSIPATGSAL